MASNKVPGSILGIRIGGQWLECQTDATLNITVNVSEEDPCKPDGDSVSPNNEIPWVERTADSRDWSVDFSSTLMRDSLNTANNPSNVAKLIIDGDVYVEAFEFATANNQARMDSDMVYSGSGILTNFTLNGPATGSATMDSTISGNGPLTYSYVPVTT